MQRRVLRLVVFNLLLDDVGFTETNVTKALSLENLLTLEEFSLDNILELVEYHELQVRLPHLENLLLRHLQNSECLTSLKECLLYDLGAEQAGDDDRIQVLILLIEVEYLLASQDD